MTPSLRITTQDTQPYLHHVGAHPNAEALAVTAAYAGLGGGGELALLQPSPTSLETFELDPLCCPAEECSAGVAAMGCSRN